MYPFAMNASTNTLLVSSLVASGLAVVATNTYAATDSAMQQGIVTTLHLNVRSAPSTTSTILGTLVQGQSVSIVNQNNGWAKISFNGKDAYISLDYVRLASPAAPSAPAQTQAATVNADKLNVRSSASTSSSILGSLVQGQSVSVLSSSNGWAKISFNGKDAFVSLAFLKLADSSASSPTPSTPAPAPAQTQAATVNADKLNVRSSASTSSSILGSLVQGQSVSVLSSSNGWAKISFNGKDAFVSLAFLKLADSSASSPAPSTPAPAPAPAQTQAATVNADKLNVRSDASTSSSIVGSLIQGQSVSVLSSSNGWAKISFNGKDAFVSLAFLKLADSSASSPTPSTPAPAPAQTQAATVNADKLNVRSSASTSSSILGSLVQGQSVSVLSSSNGWAKISFNDKDAFVSLAFLKLADSSTSSPAPSAPAPAPVQTQAATVNADKLNVRSDASTSSSILGSLVQGQSVSVLSSSNGWAKISFNGKDAFVSLAFLKLADSAANSPAPSTPVPAPAPVQTQIATVNADHLNVRSDASTSSSIVGSLIQGQSVSVLSSSNGWAKISFNGKDAFVSLAFLKLADSAANSPAPSTPVPAPVQTQIATVNADHLNVRSDASTSSSIVGSLIQGQSVSVLSSSNGWAKISFNGKDAFVSLAFLKLADSAANSPAPSTPVPAPVQTQIATVNADHLNVRSDASTSSSIVGSLIQGQSVSVLSSSNGWAKISFNGKDAFVSLAFLKLADSAANSPAPSTPVPAPVQTQIATVNADHLNVRSDASTSSSIVGSLIQGQSVSVLSSSNGWAKISFNGKDAFVSLAFLKLADTPATPSTPILVGGSNPAVISTATITVPQIDVRENASYSSTSLGTVSKGSSIGIIEQSGDWIKISFNNKEGYIPALSIKPLAQEQTTTVTASILNVRDTPSINGNIIGKLNKGQTVQTISSENGWAKIQYNGSYAYVSTGYLNQSTSDVSYAVVTSTSTILQDNQTNAETLLSTTQADSYVTRNGQVIDMKNGFVRTNGVVNIYDRVTNQKLTYVAANTDLKFEKAVGSLIYVTLDGMKGYVTLQDVTLFPGMLHSPTSYYTVNNSNLIYNLYDASSSNYYSYGVGYAPTQLIQGVQYEAFDRTSIGGQDSYQYFQYVPLRISANYSADELNQFIKANRPDSPLVGTGQYFIDAANKYHINVSYLLAHAIIESGWGTSSIAKDKNNLFGFQAVDYNPYGGAASFSTLQQGIDYCAQYIDKNYLTPNSLFYNGDFLGDKARGMNVYYASDSNWSNEISSVMHKIDGMYGDRNLHSYQLGKISAGVQLVQNLAGQKAYLTNHEIIAAIKNTIQTPAGTMYELVSDDPQYSSVYVNASDLTLIKSY
ncbi:SH3 domain-containing protein [Ectobacillus sp. sgz5001026]|uniref:SH3 domain-containing protein n=1 Tax=Ectobacillus sp. sgz5001026 TaxID=3242473 RepID=UPI0036D27953